MAQRVRVDGLRELDSALAELPTATGKNVLRRVGRRSLEPFAEAARARAPVDTGQLQSSIAISTRLSKRQRSLQRRVDKDGRATVMVHTGATALPHAHMQEFGTAHRAPQPFMRPAWDGTQKTVLENVKDGLWVEIKKSAERLRRKAARKAKRGRR